MHRGDFPKFLLFLLPLAAPAHARIFPEERDRKAWDRGCPDWPARVNPGTGLERNPDVALEKSGGFLRVFSRMHVPLERGENLLDVTRSVQEKLGDGHSYPFWTLPGINEKPGGGSYFVSVDGMTIEEREPGVHFLITGPYGFHVLWFSRTGASTLEMRHERAPLPDCPSFARYRAKEEANAQPEGFKLIYRMTPRVDLLKLLMGEIWVLPRREKNLEQVDILLRVVAQPAPLVYQVMPEALVRSELDARGRRLFQNFLEFRKTASAATPSSAVVPQKVLPRVAPPKRAR